MENKLYLTAYKAPEEFSFVIDDFGLDSQNLKTLPKAEAVKIANEALRRADFWKYDRKYPHQYDIFLLSCKSDDGSDLWSTYVSRSRCGTPPASAFKVEIFTTEIGDYDPANRKHYKTFHLFMNDDIFNDFIESNPEFNEAGIDFSFFIDEETIKDIYDVEDDEEVMDIVEDFANDPNTWYSEKTPENLYRYGSGKNLCFCRDSEFFYSMDHPLVQAHIYKQSENSEYNLFHVSYESILYGCLAKIFFASESDLYKYDEENKQRSSRTMWHVAGTIIDKNGTEHPAWRYCYGEEGSRFRLGYPTKFPSDAMKKEFKRHTNRRPEFKSEEFTQVDNLKLFVSANGSIEWGVDENNDIVVPYHPVLIDQNYLTNIETQDNQSNVANPLLELDQDSLADMKYEDIVVAPYHYLPAESFWYLYDLNLIKFIHP